jgi:hypothetical protein
MEHQITRDTYVRLTSRNPVRDHGYAWIEGWNVSDGPLFFCYVFDLPYWLGKGEDVYLVKAEFDLYYGYVNKVHVTKLCDVDTFIDRYYSLLDHKNMLAYWACKMKKVSLAKRIISDPNTVSTFSPSLQQKLKLFLESFNTSNN